MNIGTFLSQASLWAPLEGEVRVFNFISTPYVKSIIFFGHLIASLKKKGNLVVSIPLLEINYPELVSRLEMSFLGMSQIFWLREIEYIDKKYSQSLLNYLSSYRGPHTLIIMSEDIELRSSTLIKTISLDVSMTPQLWEQLAQFLDKKITLKHQEFFKTVCQHYEKITLDQACLIMVYMQLIGVTPQTVALCQSIIEPEQSLFDLSSYFFAKNPKSFFSLWADLEPRYSYAFWCTFWSEQLWRAYYAYYFLAKQQPAQAKTITFRLPFSFIQKDWKRTSLNELKKCHQALYDIEIGFKNNKEVSYGFDILFNNFFLSSTHI